MKTSAAESSRYHQSRIFVMGKGRSPTCRQIVSRQPEVTDGRAVFAFEIDGYHHVMNLIWAVGSYDCNLFYPLYQVGVAMAEVYRLCEIVTPDEILIDWYSCQEWEREWWNEDIYWYLQQKFYLEGWSWDRLPRVKFRDSSSNGQSPVCAGQGGYLLAISGGKESTFAWEWLRRAGLSHEELTLHHSGGPYGFDWESKFPVFDLVRKSGLLHEFRMFPNADPAQHFNYEGLRNDPTITNLLFLMLFVGDCRGLKFVAMANDRSAEESNAIHEGREVNHQSAKGGSYLARFNQFLRRKGQDSRYVSLCEGVYSIGAVKKLNDWKSEALGLISSCNEAQWQPGNQRWCRNCSKCAFTYALLEAIAGRSFAMKIVGEDLIIKKELYPTWATLYDEKFQKPFECVGERRESAYALNRIAWQRSRAGLPMGFLNIPGQKLDEADLFRVNLPGWLPSHDVSVLKLSADVN